MIMLNGKPCPVHQGWTIRSLLDYKRYTYPKIIVTINGAHIEPEEYAEVPVSPGDVVQVIHMMAGG